VASSTHDAHDAHDQRDRALLDTAPDAMIVVASDCRITFANLQAEAIFGYPRAALIGQPLELLIPERFRARHSLHLSRFFERPSARPMGSSIELFALRKDGVELPIEVSLSPLETATGLTVSASIRDISERKKLEAAAKLSNDRLVSAVESITDAFALFDDCDRLVLCNRVFRNLIGSALPGSIIGRPYGELLEAWLDEIAFDNTVDRERFRTERLACRRQSQTASFDLRVRDGRTLRVIDRPTPDGGSVKTVWDVSEDMRLAEDLRVARATAEAASHAKSEFLSLMSHELRTPLNAILGFAQLLQRDKRHPLSSRHLERVQHIASGGAHLLCLIDEILDLSRIESGAIPISLEPTSISEVIEQVMPTLTSLAARAELTLELEKAANDFPLIVADRTRFAQILMNFASNAIKYNRPGGRVTLRVIVPSRERVRLIVSDTWIGVPPDKQAKLFQPFQRAGQEAGPIEGTGIGLFLTKRLAQLMHGEVGFRSVFEQGSEFWVDMPIASTCSQASLPRTPVPRLVQRSSLAGRRCLLYIEDDVANVAFMRDLIESTFDAVELVTASSGERGLELLGSRVFDAVILDINLPGLSGFDTVQELRKDRARGRLPVIALSAAASAGDKQRGLQSGFYAYLTKPVDVDELVAMLEKLFSPRAESVPSASPAV